MPKILRKTYQVKISLRGSQPPIWRRFLIKNSVTLRELHEVIQVIMGWTNDHLHQFISGDRYYGIPEPDFGFSEFLDEKKYKLGQLLESEKESMIYEYDFGDSWEHKITLEKILPFDPDADLPKCIKAKGACPPEDIGGIWGYYSFLEALNDENHPEREVYEEWIGMDFDSAAYDIEGVNAVLSRYFR